MSNEVYLAAGSTEKALISSLPSSLLFKTKVINFSYSSSSFLLVALAVLLLLLLLLFIL